MLIHIVSSVSRVPAYLWMATLVFWRFSWVVLLGGAFLASFIPLYAIAWVSALSFGPCISNSSEIVRLILSSSIFIAPTFARASLPSFPSFPSWPFTHWKVVGAVHILRCAAFLNRGAFFMPIQPWLSHCSRCVVSPSGHGVASIPIRVLYSHAGPVGTAEDLLSQMTKSKYHVIRQVIQITCEVT
jgi:hypothetical protein